MSGFLTDTNVISEYARPNPNPDVFLWFDRVSPDKLFASVITFGELHRGIESLPPGKRRANLEAWISDGLPAWFAPNLLPVSSEIARRWAQLTVRASRQGMPLSMPDGLIAATAIEHNLTLVTRNVTDFEGSRVRLANPFQ